jgi:hypothetical protein
MTMDFRFYKADPEPGTNVQWPEQDPGAEPTFTLVALQRDADPDANTHDGFDYFGAHGVGDDIDAWAGGQPVTAITKDQLPSPVTFYPAPFNEA